MIDDDDGRDTSAERAVHLVRLKGRLLFSGYNGSGDPCMGRGGVRPGPDVPRHPYAFVIDVGGDHAIDPALGLVVPRVSKTSGFLPDGLALAARLGLFGFRLLGGTEAGPKARVRKG